MQKTPLEGVKTFQPYLRGVSFSLIIFSLSAVPVVMVTQQQNCGDRAETSQEVLVKPSTPSLSPASPQSTRWSWLVTDPTQPRPGAAKVGEALMQNFLIREEKSTLPRSHISETCSRGKSGRQVAEHIA